MIAVDTNVVVRFLTGDDRAQLAAATALFDANEVAIADTVFLEAEWVLRKGYRFSPHEIAAAFDRLLGLDGVRVASRDVLLDAMSAFRQGCDFADALHAATAPAGIAAMMTFDQAFVRQAKGTNLPPIRLLEGH